MKIWLFALLQSLIATLGLAAYFWADNLGLATTAAVLAASLGVLQPLLTAHKARKLEEYQNRQYQKSFDALDEQLQSLLDQSIDPPLPHHASVAALFRRQSGADAQALCDAYDRVVNALRAGGAESVRLAREFGRRAGGSVASYLQGLAAQAAGDVESACRHFTAARDAQPAWVSPWLGWAATHFALGRVEEIREHHPHVNGVELLPYDAGDESTFLELDDQHRAELTDLFQTTAASLGNYYAAAEFCRSKAQIAASREEWQKAA